MNTKPPMTPEELELKRQEYETRLVDIIIKKKWMRWSHIDWTVVGMARSTAYLYKLEKSDAIKEQLAENRSKAVDYLVQKWIASDNATLQIAAMRIVAEEDDRQRLNQQYVDHTSKGDKIDNKFEIEIITKSDEISPEETN